MLDFIGQHHREFRFDTQFRALLSGTRRDVERQLKAGFPYLPAGCHLSLDRVASKRVLTSIRQALPSGWRAMQRELAALTGTLRRPPTLTEFLDETGLELEDVYAANRSWSDLLHSAEVSGVDASHGPHERVLRRALGRLLHATDAERLDAWLTCSGNATDEKTAPDADPVRWLNESTCRARLTNMLSATLFTSLPRADKPATPQACITLLRQHPAVCRELGELLRLLKQRQDHAFAPVTTHASVPLQVHACYTRVEMLAALGEGEGSLLPSWREGVRYVEPAKVDLLAFTLNKTDKHFSPTTRYRDHAISRRLIHWESQSSTPADSPVGQRYQHHQTQGSAIWLFARVNSGDAFRFLGPAHYVSHQGERPMAITWKLAHPLPGDLFEAYGVAVA